MKHILVMTSRELKSYFYSPIAYIVAVIFLTISGVLFWPVFFVQNQAELRNYFVMLPWLLTFIIPAITMRSFSEEKSTGSYELLMTLPVRLYEIVLAKFLSSALLVWSMMFFIFLYALSVEWVGDLDWGPVLGGFIGAIFLSSGYLSIGIFSSLLTSSQVIAFLVGLFINLFIFLIDKFFIFLPSLLVDFFSFFSSEKHFRNFSKGIVDSRDVLFFVFITLIFLLATHEMLNRQFAKKK